MNDCKFEYDLMSRRRRQRRSAVSRSSFHEPELPLPDLELDWEDRSARNASLPRLLPAGVTSRDITPATSSQEEERHYRACTLNGIRRNFTIAV